MDKKLLQKYFRNQCTLDELEKILDWFQTDEGEEYLEKRMNRDMEFFANEENLLLHPDVPTDEMLDAIGRERRKNRFRRKRPRQDAWWSRVAIVLLICGALSAGSYWFLYDAVQMEGETPEIVYRTLSTMEDQQRLVTLDDGTRIRLNSNSSIEIPETFVGDGREVRLNGEAWFKVERDENRPFSIKADRAVIRVLGTEFNVKADQNSPKVQVAVTEGRVSLSGESDINGREAILTENTFAEYDLENGEILIEQTPVDNYLSWISGNLHFYSEPLWVVSRYLERLYDVSFQFSEDELRELTLSADLMRRELTEVLDIITQTLGIGYRYEEEDRRVTYIRNGEARIKTKH